jgi:hypothetical protein
VLHGALDALRNEDIASMARVGSRVSDIEPGLWDHVKEIKGGWRMPWRTEPPSCMGAPDGARTDQ